MLIITTQSPFSKTLPPAVNTVSLVLTQDAVIAATTGHVSSGYNNVYALHSDLDARGLMDHISEDIQVIDLSDFVKLTTQHQPLVNW